jgi:hypothetical protein
MCEILANQDSASLQRFGRVIPPTQERTYIRSAAPFLPMLGSSRQNKYPHSCETFGFANE